MTALLGRIKERLRDIFWPEVKLNEFFNQDDYKTIQDNAQLSAELQAQVETRLEYVEASHLAMDIVGIMFWIKDAEHKYTFADVRHCQSFFGYPGTDECLEYIKNKTDEELLAEINKEHNLDNNFDIVCLLTDMYIKEQQEVIHFFEAGRIGGEQKFLYVVKTPMFDEQGNYTGSVGIAKDITDNGAFICSIINTCMPRGLVTKLHHSDESFAYAISSEFGRCDVFSHICPKPFERDFNCELCNTLDQLKK